MCGVESLRACAGGGGYRVDECTTKERAVLVSLGESVVNVAHTTMTDMKRVSVRVHVCTLTSVSHRCNRWRLR
jgi:hypothetical protein